MPRLEYCLVEVFASLERTKELNLLILYWQQCPILKKAIPGPHFGFKVFSSNRIFTANQCEKLFILYLAAFELTTP